MKISQRFISKKTLSHIRIIFAACFISLLILTGFSPTVKASPSELKNAIRKCYFPNLQLPSQEIVISGVRLNEEETYNILWFSQCVAPFLPGTALEKATYAARASWWALRENNLEVSGAAAFSYSNCHIGGQDRNRSQFWNFDCPSNLWQVGIAGGQVANYTDEEYEITTKQILSTLGPNITMRDLLTWTAMLSGFHTVEKDDPNYFSKKLALGSILRATGRVRNSWLLRNPLIGTLLVQDLEVKRECLMSHSSYCFSGDWPAAKNFSGGRTLALRIARMKRSINDLKKFYLRVM